MMRFFLLILAMIPPHLHGLEGEPVPAVKPVAEAAVVEPEIVVEVEAQSVLQHEEKQESFGLLLETASLEGVAGVEEVMPLQAVVWSIPGCGPCQRMHDEIPSVLPFRGWTVGGEHDMVCFREFDFSSTEFSKFPTTVFYVRGKEVDRVVGYISPIDLAARANKLFKEQPVAASEGAMQAIPVGTLQGAKPQVDLLLKALKPILGNGGTLQITYTGTEIKVPIGDRGELTAAKSVTATWSMKGDALHLQLKPPPKIRMGAMPWAQSVSGVSVTVDEITAELPWFPDLKLRVR